MDGPCNTAKVSSKAKRGRRNEYATNGTGLGHYQAEVNLPYGHKRLEVEYEE